MANEFVARNGIIALNDTTISGSLSVTNNISGSIFTGSFIGTLTGTSSFATSGSQAISASYSATASFIQASGVAGLNLSQIATGSITASVNINSGSFSVTSGSSNFFFVSSSGQIGIGDTSPSDVLVVNGRARINGTNRLAFGNSSGGYAQIGVSGATTGNLIFLNFDGATTNENMRITTDGKVGIGTTTPSVKLHVSGTALFETDNESSITIKSRTNAANSILKFQEDTAIIRWQLIAAESDAGKFKISGSGAGEALTIVSNNNIGIGTTNPGVKLDVSGSATVSGSLIVVNDITGSNARFTGTITAQTLVVQTVTSSIVYSSGSNIFGNLATNNQIFTGSVLISGSITVSGSVTNNLTASYALNADALDGINSTQLATTGSNIFRGNQSITGSLIVSSSTFATSLIGSGSGVFTVDGTSGRLFSVDDSLSGSLFSVNTAAGLPVMEAFSDNTVRIGQFGRRALFVSQSAIGIGKETGINGILDISGSTVITGSLIVTGSTNVIGDVTGSNARFTGTITAQTLVVQTVSSSITYSSGSNIFGNSLANTQTFTGSVGMTGSLNVVGNTTITGSLTVTGSVFITSASINNQQILSTNSGSYQIVTSTATGSYKAAFFDYVIFSGSATRAGTVVSTWSNTAIDYYENYTNDVSGSTSKVTLRVALTGSNVQLQATSSNAAWTIRSLIRLI